MQKTESEADDVTSMDAKKITIGLLLAALLSSCSSIPASIDPTTYIFYEREVLKQQVELKYPLIGMYSLQFSGEGMVETPENAKSVKGDFKFAAVKRGADLDFVSMSGFSGFGGFSDQGGSYSVNLQGAAYWSFPIGNIELPNKTVVGSSNGLIDGKRGKATIEMLNGGWYRVQVIFDKTRDASASASSGETFFLRKLF